MGTELLLPSLGILLMAVALLAASYSSAVFSKRHNLVASSVFGMCVGIAIMLVASVVAWWPYG